MRSKERRAARRHPDTLKRIVAMLPSGAKVISFQPHGWDWLAEVRVGRRQFQLESQYGCINICVLDGGALREVMSPKKPGIDVSVEGIAETMRKHLA